MKKYLALGAAMLIASPAFAAAYLPVGPQQNVSLSTVLGGGWTQCLSEDVGHYGTNLATTFAGCTGSHLMLAGRVTGSSTILLLAQALKSDVLTDTGTGTNSTHLANGSQWYYNSSYSMGFASAGSNTYRLSCDASGIFNGDSADGANRLCWHTGGGTLNGGWRVGTNVWLNGEPSGFDRLIFSSNGVPEPAAWALMIAGFGLVGTSLRRRRTDVVAA